MELVKNRASGKYFVVLDDTGETEFLVITPEGKVKRLEQHLFEAQDAVDPKDGQWVCNLTKKQMDKYSEYFCE